MMAIPPCKDGCGLWAVAPKMLTIAELLELQFKDIVWTSGSRCPTHNRAVGGSENSGHKAIWGDNGIESVALDGTLRVWNPFRAREVCRRAIQHGARGVGYMPDLEAFHFDLKPRTAWWVVRNGKIEYFF